MRGGAVYNSLFQMNGSGSIQRTSDSYQILQQSKLSSLLVIDIILLIELYFSPNWYHNSLDDPIAGSWTPPSFRFSLENKNNQRCVSAHYHTDLMGHSPRL